MPVDDAQRAELFETITQSWGPRAASTLMAMLPPSGAEFATKDDLNGQVALLRSDLRAEMAELRTELKTEMAELRTELKTEMAELRAELKTDMSELRTELKTEMSELRTDVRAEMAAFRGEMRVELRDALRDQTWRLLTFIVPSIFSGVGLAFAAARFA